LRHEHVVVLLAGCDVLVADAQAVARDDAIVLAPRQRAEQAVGDLVARGQRRQFAQGDDLVLDRDCTHREHRGQRDGHGQTAATSVVHAPGRFGNQGDPSASRPRCLYVSCRRRPTRGRATCLNAAPAPACATGTTTCPWPPCTRAAGARRTCVLRAAMASRHAGVRDRRTMKGTATRHRPAPRRYSRSPAAGPAGRVRPRSALHVLRSASRSHCAPVARGASRSRPSRGFWQDATMPNTGTRDLTQGPIGRTLFVFALPILGGNVLQSLNGSVNAIWVGRFLGEEALTATANANNIMFFLIGAVFGVGMAATILV